VLTLCIQKIEYKYARATIAVLKRGEVCPMPYALCPMLYARRVPHVTEKGYSSNYYCV